MTKEIMIEILDSGVTTKEKYSVAFRYSIVDVKTDAVIVQSGETEATVWETVISTTGNYYIKVEGTCADGDQTKLTEPLWLSTIQTI